MISFMILIIYQCTANTMVLQVRNGYSIVDVHEVNDHQREIPVHA